MDSKVNRLLSLDYCHDLHLKLKNPHHKSYVEKSQIMVQIIFLHFTQVDFI